MRGEHLRDATHALSVPSALYLSEKIMGLRIAAAAIYDRAKVLNHKDSEIAAEIEPLRKKMKELIAVAVKEDLAGCILTVNRLRAQAKAHEQDIKFLMQKAVDAEHHANEICREIVEDLKARGISERHDRDFSAVLVSEGEQEKLTLR